MRADDAGRGEAPIEPIRGTRAVGPGEFGGIAALGLDLMRRFEASGYRAIRTPILEPVELHERKSGAGIVSKLIETSGPVGRACLRPELTAGIVRAYAESPEASGGLPWRVAQLGPVFRLEAPRVGVDREFHQVGVECLGGGGPAIDAELIWMADDAVGAAGLADRSIRIGHVGILLEALRKSGLPASVHEAIIERLSDASAEGREDQALDDVLGRLAGWTTADGEGGAVPEIVAPDGRVDRLFRTLVPTVIGRRSGRDVVDRLRRKWDLAHSLASTLDSVRARIREIASLKGPPSSVLERLDSDHRSLVPDSVRDLRDLARALDAYGVREDRVEIDLGFGRGIGFYTQMVFAILTTTPAGPLEICGGGRYDGLARVFGSGRDDRGVGFAIGLERLSIALAASRATRPTRPGPARILISASPPEDDFAAAIAVRRAIRDPGGPAPTLVVDGGRSREESIRVARDARMDAVVEVRGDGRGRPVEIRVVHLGTEAEGSDAAHATARSAGLESINDLLFAGGTR